MPRTVLGAGYSSLLINLSLLKSKMMIVIDDTYIKAAGIDEDELKLEIAIMLFEKEKLSLRKAASFADLNWLLFMKELDKRGISIHYDETML